MERPQEAREREAARRFLARRGWSPGQHPAASLMRARAQQALESRAGELGAGDLRAAAKAALAGKTGNNAAPPTNLGGTWQPLGPAQVATNAFGNVTGRVSSIAVDPSDSSGNTVYLGTTGGGVWRSTNAAGAASAVAFSPLTDSLPGSSALGGASLSIGAVSVQPGGTGVVLAGTGDPNDALDSYWGSGIERSTDGGLTWSLIVQSSVDHSVGGQYPVLSFIGEAFSAFAWSTSSPNLVVAAVSQSTEGTVVNAPGPQSQVGLYYSMDAGSTWILATIRDPGGAYVQAPQLPPGTLAAATAVVWNPVRRLFYAAIRFHGYYQSSDGVNWTRLASQPGTSLNTSVCPGSYSSFACPMFRGALAVQPVSGDLFAITTDVYNINQGVWHDACSQVSGSCGSSNVNFQALPSQTLQDSSGVIAQADYNLWITAVPVKNDTLLYAGTEDIFRCSLAAGCSWRNTTNIDSCGVAQIAPAQHAVDSTFAGSTTSAAAGLMFFGNDGGLWRTTDGISQTGAPCSPDDAAHFQNLNAALGSLAEVNDFAVDPTDASTILAAEGAFGTSASVPADPPVWPQVLDGEGSHVAIDPANPSDWFSASASGVSIHECTAGTACSIAGFGQTIIGSAQVGGDGDALAYPAPWILDPQDSTRIIVGTCRIWRGPATGGSSWSAANALSPFLDADGPSTANPVCTSNGVVRSLAASGTVSNLPGVQERVYAGMAGPFDGGSTVAGHIYTAAVSSLSGSATAWTDISNSTVTNDLSGNLGLFNPGGFAISTIAIDPHDPTGQTIYAGIEGFSGNGISEPRLYASTDGGAHWLNITNFLPDSPVNSVVIDPNDANTVYVGLDVGVYITREITTCSVPSSRCWSPYGTGLPNAPIIKLNVVNGATPAQGMLQAATYGRGIWQTGLIPTGTTGTLTPASLTFADQAISTASAAQPLTLSNTGGVALSIGQIALTGGYTETDNCNGSVAPNSSCVIEVTFVPLKLGAAAGSVVVYANVPGGQLTASLNGNGLQAATIVVDPLTVVFPSLLVGDTSKPPQNVTISNVGGVASKLTSETVGGDFKIVNDTCGGTLAPNSGCSVAIAFTPTASGTRSSSLIIVDDAGTQTVPLTGTGQTPATDSLGPAMLRFPPEIVGTPSAPQTVTLTNSGDQSLSSIAASVDAAHAGDFIVANGCGTSLVGHASCSITVTYVPTRAGAESASLTVSDDLQTHTVQLTASGVAAAFESISPVELDFGSQVLNTASPAQFVTLTNSPGAALTLIGATTTGDFVLNPAGTTCTPTLQGGSNCTYSVSYLPTQTGPESGSLNITDANGLKTVALTGTGLAPTTLSASPTALSFGAVNLLTGSAPETVTFTSQLATPIAGILLTITGDYTIAAGACPATLAAGASCSVQIVFTPTVAGIRTGLLTATSSSFPAVTVQLTGTGQAAATDILAPSTVDFGSIPLNTASITRHISLTNGGDATLTGIMARTTGAFLLETGTCGPTLPGHGSCVFAVEFQPTTAGANTGSLIVAESLQTQTVVLTGYGQAAATDILTPAALSFGNQVVPTTSSPQQVTLQNTGDLPLNGVSVQITGAFAISNNLCQGTLPLHTSCTITVTFQPVTAGPVTGTLTVTDAIRAQTVALSGTGVAAPTDTLSPSSLTFFPQALNTTSTPQSVTLTNSGAATLTGITAVTAGDFVLDASTTCGASLAIGTSCFFAVDFMPTHTGVEVGTLTVTDALRTQTVSLNGPMQSPATDALSPSNLAFGSQQIGLPSASQSVTLTNSGDATLTGIKLKTDGDFSWTSNCGLALGGQAECTISVIYTPSHTGAATGTLTVTDALQAQKVPLTGAGTDSGGGGGTPTDTLSPLSLVFGAQPLGVASAAQTVTLSNTGTGTLTGIKFKSDGDFSVTGTCGASLAPQTSCTLSVVYTPTHATAATGTLTVTDDLQVQKVSLTGAGTSSGGGGGAGSSLFSLVPEGSGSATIASGATAKYVVDVVPAAGSAGSVAMSCTVAAQFATCAVSPATAGLTPGANVPVAITVATGVGISLSSAEPGSFSGSRIVLTVLAALLPLGLWRRSKLRMWVGSEIGPLRTWLMLGILGVSAIVLSGCGGAVVSSGSQTRQNVTPPGTYQVTVTGTLGASTVSAALNLTVQ
ncbi:MAG TPA: choice-of-anchor D domain-containing protein [Acidisarcina sp.]